MTDTTPQRLWNRDFVAYWTGMAAGTLGDAFVMVALPFLVLEITGSGAALATVALLGTIPRFLGPLTGALADRLHLQGPFLAIGLLRAGLFAGLALAAMADALPIWTILVAAPLNGLLTSFTAAAGMVLLPGLVPRSELARANSLMQGALMGVPLLGLGLAGALVGALGVAATLLAAAPLLLSLAVAALVVRFPVHERPTSGLNVLGDMRDAVAFLARSGPLAFLLVMSLCLNAALNLLGVTVPVGMERAGHGAQGYGLFQSFLSAGMLAGIVAVGFAAKALAPRTLVGLAQLLMAGGFGVLAAGGLALQLAGAAVLGFGLGATEVAAVTLLQLAVPDGMRGKVLGVVFTVNAVGLALGAWVAGRVIESLAVAPLFAAAALGLAALALVWLVLQARGREVLDRLATASAGSVAA